MRTLLPLAACGLVFALSACRDDGTLTGLGAALAPPGEAVWFVLPIGADARAGAVTRLEFRSGDDARTPVLDAPALDPAMFRVGGFQDNALRVERIDGRVGLRVVSPQAGDVMVGCSTRPEPARWQGESVALTRHAKALFFVGGPELAAPIASAALVHRFGLRLELVPMVDPLPLLVGDRLPLQLHFDGSALAGVPVSVRRAGAQGGESAIATSDAVGAVSVPIAEPGTYLVSAVHDPRGRGEGRDVHVATLTFTVGGPR